MSTYLSIFADRADRRFGRHVVWDDASRDYALPDVIAYGVSLPRAVQHARVVPVLDQGDVGACTANALLGCLGTEPFATQLRERYRAVVDLATFDEALALDVYYLDEGVAHMVNSWGTSWGRDGTAKIRLGDLRWLLSSRMQGDVVQPVIV
jgi:hypothetical protein